MIRWLFDEGERGSLRYAMQGWWGVASYGVCLLVALREDFGPGSTACFAALAGVSFGRVIFARAF